MRSHPAITPLLVKSGAYRDLEHPVILARGDLGIYFVQAEKLCRDDPSFIEKYAADPVGMIAHAAGLMEQHPEFKMVIDALAETVQHCFDDYEHHYVTAVSGGQRRDWLFSGLVAQTLKVPHLALFKDGLVQTPGYQVNALVV